VSRQKTSGRSKLGRYFGAFNFLGVVLGIIFVDLSLLPSLLPRGWVLQGVLSAVLFCIGYGLGTLVSYLIRKFEPKEPRPDGKKQFKLYTYIVLGISFIVFLLVGAHLQREVRGLVGQPTDPVYHLLGTVLLAVLLTALILLISRSIRTLYHWLGRLIDRVLPKGLAYLLGFALTVFLIVGFVNGFLLNGLMDALNQSFSVKNGTTNEGVVKPTAPELSGSPQSLIPWDTLGRQGRNFIGEAESTKKLSDFNHTQATQPIRVYSGLESADSTEARAQLAVKDMKRAGAFDRKIIVVVTTTGTGWVDEEGVVPIEYMYNGDSAIVAMQYSYLPSWLSFLVDQSKARDAGNELYNAVYDESLSIPEGARPKIVVFGESLGSFGGESAFSNLAAFKSTSDGAVWAGPPNFNTLWRKVVNGRDAGSPEILPIYQNGETVRFAAKHSDFKRPDKTWSSPKVAYLQNPSDPIVWWSPKLLFEKPDWLSEPRGADVSSHTVWLPIITFWQVSGDMVFSTGVPDGHGHKYGKLPTDAWGYVAPSDGWTPQKTEDLKRALGG
jgi:uncharacterized membrane protein